ncbi:hypothetical protein COB11_05590 [Candidatus Aerophobetes bacterium]|uniref:Uncharacterized protein n=1 Tax=Aerophobetes bacterium TaxID=2030807 RepID=A0A2A4YFM2_UNCAE|nr:MAG: hypothetical protein COB11_05590 [Candidatus Aerophobetes bacterium]
MHKTFKCFLLAILFSTTQITFGAPVLVKENQVCCEIKSLLKRLGYTGEYDLDSVFTYTQKHWMQFPKNRWDFSKNYQNNKNELFPYFNKLNLLEKIEAKKTHYDLAAIHGATLSRMRNRIAYLAAEWEKGVRFDKITFLTGPRTLQKSFEGKKDLLTASCELPFAKETVPTGALPENEMQMAKFIYESAKLPDGMRNLPVEYICAEIKSAHLFPHTTPTTSDAILTFLESNPKEKTLLLVSNQPFVMYQDIITRYFLQQEFEIETIGDRAHENITVSVLIDNIAKCLFWEKLARDKFVD